MSQSPATVAPHATYPLDAEPFGTCTAHRRPLWQSADYCDQHPPVAGVECLELTVGCDLGCITSTRHL